MEPFVAVATVPDRGRADLLAEVLRGAGVEPVEVAGVPAMAYLGSATRLSWEVRVLGSQRATAEGVLGALAEDGPELAAAEADEAQPAVEHPGPPTPRPSLEWLTWPWLAGAALLLLAVVLVLFLR